MWIHWKTRLIKKNTSSRAMFQIVRINENIPYAITKKSIFII